MKLITEKLVYLFIILALWLAGAAASDANDLTATTDDKVSNSTNLKFKIYLIHHHKGAVSKVQVLE
jgi:uncharacterized protein (DUF305 family)